MTRLDKFCAYTAQKIDNTAWPPAQAFWVMLNGLGSAAILAVEQWRSS